MSRLFWRLGFPVLLFVVLSLSGPVAAQSLEPLRRMMDKANADAQTKGMQLRSALKRGINCDSAKDASAVPMYDAFAQQMALAEAMAGSFENFGGVQRSRDTNAEARLEIADVALASNCIVVADELYRSVLKLYVEPRFAGLRDIAKLGIEDIRDRKRAAPVR